MSPLKKLQLRKIELRRKLNDLGGVEAPTDEQRAELETLSGEFDTLEVREAALLRAEDEGEEEEEEMEDEDRKLVELRSRVSLSRYVSAAMQDQRLDGAEAEYNQQLNMRESGAFPLEFLAPARIETRATTNVDSQANQGRWIDRLFADTAASFMGVTMESVAPGVASFPVTTAGASAAQRGRSQAAADAAWTVGVTELKPTRNAVRAVFSQEDAMRLPGLEDSLQRDLQAALTEGIDRTIFVGDSTANPDEGDITGFTTYTGLDEQTVTQANKVKAAETLAAFLAMIDGKHAGMVEDLRAVLSVGAHNLWAGTIANSAAENQTLLAFLKANGLMCMTRGDIETATGNNRFGAFVGRQRGITGAAVAAIWNSGMLIRDPYSDAAKGEVALTLSYFWDFDLPRHSNFSRIKFVT